jgi:hypothetical protein
MFEQFRSGLCTYSNAWPLPAHRREAKKETSCAVAGSTCRTDRLRGNASLSSRSRLVWTPDRNMSCEVMVTDLVNSDVILLILNRLHQVWYPVCTSMGGFSCIILRGIFQFCLSYVTRTSLPHPPSGLVLMHVLPVPCIHPHRNLLHN